MTFGLRGKAVFILTQFILIWYIVGKCRERTSRTFSWLVFYAPSYKAGNIALGKIEHDTCEPLFLLYSVSFYLLS